MVQLGCNYSQPLLALLAAGEVEVDWIKLSRDDTLEQEIVACRPIRPCLVHTLPKAGLPAARFQRHDWDRVRGCLVAAGSPHVALHLEVRGSDVADPQDGQAIIDGMVANIQMAKTVLPVPLLIENTVYRAHSDILRVCTEPDVICRVMEQTGTGLLLDTAHLRCSARNMGMDARAYAAALPLDLVPEIHVAGIRTMPDGELNDSHGDLTEEDYALLAWLLERTRPQMVTLEYGGTGPVYERPGMSDPEILKRLLSRLKGMLS